MQIKQGHLVGLEPQLASVGPGHAFVKVELGGSLLHHLLVIGAVLFSHVGRREIVVVLADDRRWTVQACIGGKRPIAAQKNAIFVFPKDALRNSVQNRLEHLA